MPRASRRRHGPTSQTQFDLNQTTSFSDPLSFMHVELILFGLVPLFLTLATVWILWHSLEKINPHEVTRHGGIRNHRVVALVSNHCGGGCDRSESKGQKEPTYSVDLRFALRVARLAQV
jgi:hypothetical protein